MKFSATGFTRQPNYRQKANHWPPDNSLPGAMQFNYFYRSIAIKRVELIILRWLYYRSILLPGRIRIFFSIESNNSEISVDVIKAIVLCFENRICTAVHSAPVAYLFPLFIPTSEYPVLLPTSNARPSKEISFPPSA